MITVSPNSLSLVLQGKKPSIFFRVSCPLDDAKDDFLHIQLFLVQKQPHLFDSMKQQKEITSTKKREENGKWVLIKLLIRYSICKNFKSAA